MKIIIFKNPIQGQMGVQLFFPVVGSNQNGEAYGSKLVGAKVGDSWAIEDRIVKLKEVKVIPPVGIGVPQNVTTVSEYYVLKTPISGTFKFVKKTPVFDVESVGFVADKMGVDGETAPVDVVVINPFAKESTASKATKAMFGLAGLGYGLYLANKKNGGFWLYFGYAIGFGIVGSMAGYAAAGLINSFKKD